MPWLVSDARPGLCRGGGRWSRKTPRTPREGRSRGCFLIDPCRWVHTIGMRFPLDVAFLDEDNNVVKTVRMARHRVGWPVRGGRWVIEAEAGAFARWNLASVTSFARDEDHPGP